MKILHRPEIDYVSIDFRDDLEAKSVFHDGIIVRYDKKGQVIGLDITDSSQFFKASETLGLKEACKVLGISESTMRRRIRSGQIKCKRHGGKNFRFRRKDLLKMAG